MQALEDLSLQYDSTVRNSENTVVQFTYGDDGLHPDKMENNDRPVDFDRLRLHVAQLYPCLDEDAVSVDSLMNIVDERLNLDPFKSLGERGCRVFLQEIRDFFTDIVTYEKSLRQSGSESYSLDSEDDRKWLSTRLTETQVAMILKTAHEKFLLSFVEPGEACGAIGAQSISEPGTQMTLKVRNLH